LVAVALGLLQVSLIETVARTAYLHALQIITASAVEQAVDKTVEQVQFQQVLLAGLVEVVEAPQELAVALHQIKVTPEATERQKVAVAVVQTPLERTREVV
jgi:hypothetical protein